MSTVKATGRQEISKDALTLAFSGDAGSRDAQTDGAETDRAETLPVDLDWFIAGRALVQATSRAGKSWLARFILEQTHGRLQHLVVDPEGEYASLRENFDYLLVSAEGGAGDLRATVETAPALCRGIMEASVSVILDLYAMKLDERRAFVGAFLGELMSLGREYWRPLLTVIDEAHRFAPQDGAVASSEAVAELTSQGGKRAYGSLLMTQRMSKLDKDVAADLQNVFIGRTQLDVDVRRAADNLGFSKRRYPELRRLEPGRFFAYGPAFPSAEVVRVKSGPVVTTHPEAGKVAAVPPPAPAALKTVITELGATLEGAALEGAAGGGATLEQAENQEALVEEPAAGSGGADGVTGGRQTGRTGGRTSSARRPRDLELERQVGGLQKERAELKRRLESLESKNVQLRKQSEDLLAEKRALQQGISEGRERIGSLLEKAATALHGIDDSRYDSPAGSDAGQPAASETKVEPGLEATTPTTATTAATPENAPVATPKENPDSAVPAGFADLAGTDSAAKGSGAQRRSTKDVGQPEGADRILRTLADLEGIGMTEVPRPALAVLSGFANHKSGTFSRYVGDLRAEGYVRYPADGVVSLTAEGRSQTTGSGAIRTLSELHERWLSRLDGGTRRIVDQLVPVYPEGMSREELAQRAGFESSGSGTFSRYVGVLKKVGFVHYPERGVVAMTPALFPEGL